MVTHTCSWFADRSRQFRVLDEPAPTAVPCLSTGWRTPSPLRSTVQKHLPDWQRGPLRVLGLDPHPRRGSAVAGSPRPALGIPALCSGPRIRKSYARWQRVWVTAKPSRRCAQHLLRDHCRGVPSAMCSIRPPGVWSAATGLWAMVTPSDRRQGTGRLAHAREVD